MKPIEQLVIKNGRNITGESPSGSLSEVSEGDVAIELTESNGTGACPTQKVPQSKYTNSVVGSVSKIETFPKLVDLHGGSPVLTHGVNQVSKYADKKLFEILLNQ